MYGLSSNRGLGTRFLEGLTIAEQMASYADTANDKAGYTVAHRFYGTLCMFLPSYQKGQSHIQKSNTVYEGMNSYKFFEKYGHDPKGYGLGMSAMTSILTGFPDQGMALMEKSISHANALNFPSLISLTQESAAKAFRILRNPEKTKIHADMALRIAREGRFSFLEGVSLSSCMWAEHHLENPPPPTKTGPALEALKRTGSDVFFLWLITCHIDVLLREQRADEARAITRQSISISERAGCKWFLPELLRFDAICGVKEDNPDLSNTEATLLQSIQLAKSQGAKFWELRSTVELSRLWGEQRERRKAYDFLFPVYNWFTEGFGTTDLKEAKTLLHQLL